MAGILLNEINYSVGGSSGGAVDSVNGKTGTVVLGLSDLDGDSTHRTVSDAEKSSWNDVSGKQDTLVIGSDGFINLD